MPQKLTKLKKIYEVQKILIDLNSQNVIDRHEMFKQYNKW